MTESNSTNSETSKTRKYWPVVLAVVLAVIGGGYWAYLMKRSASEIGAVTEAQINKAGLHDFAIFANAVRAAYDQRISEEQESKSKLICAELFKEVDLSILAQELSVDIEDSIQQIVKNKNVASNTWTNCAAECTCSTLSDLLALAIEKADEPVDPEVLSAASQAAESLTTSDAISCAQAAANICDAPFARRYAEQATTPE